MSPEQINQYAAKINTSSTYGKINVEKPKDTQNGDDHTQIRDEEQKIEISKEAQRLQNSETSTFNQQKVDEVKKAIANGTFKVDPEKIADKMRDEAVEMMKRKLQQAYNTKKGNEGVLGA